VSKSVEYLIGTASWTDPTPVKSNLFYPSSVRTSEDRLRFYAQRFNTVEVDSTYYALPALPRPCAILCFSNSNGLKSPSAHSSICPKPKRDGGAKV
jgi:hypothetical protein